MAEDLLVFPTGAIALDNGDLGDVTNVKVDQSRDAKLINTLRKTAAGVFIGHEKTELSFDAVVGKEGAERDYYKMLMTGKVKTVRIKIPGETFAVVGVIDKRSLELPTDDAIKYSVHFIGKTVV